jgi:hypothetical protein
MTARVSQPTCILVIGAHRSGTSAVARTLGLMGAAEARRLMPANVANPSGFWEAEAVVEAHDRFLAAVGSRWDDPHPLPPEAFAGAAADACRAALTAALAEEFAGAPLYLVKDPRLCRLAPLMLDVLAGLGVKPCVVSPVRAPAAVARSLAAREGFSHAKGYALWLGDVLAAERSTRSAERLFVGYETLAADPVRGARRLAATLGFPTVAADGAAAEIAAYWGEAGLRAQAVAPDAPLPRLATRVHAALASGHPSAGEMDATLAEFAAVLRSRSWRRTALADEARRLASRLADKLSGRAR